MLSSKTLGKIALFLGSSFFALTLAYFFLNWYFRGTFEATSFKDLNDLRRAMLKRDARDNGSGSVSFRSIVTPHPSDKIIYDLLPNLNVKFQDVALKTNSCGMRDVEIKADKPANTFRIALLGDSFAFAWGVEAEKSFASRLEDNLNNISRGAPKFEVLNFGVPGYSTFQEVEKFKETGQDFNVDAVLVYFVQNDFGFPFFVKNSSKAGAIFSAVEMTVLHSHGDPKARAEVNALVRENPNESLKQLAEICEKQGIDLYLAFNPSKTWRSDKHAISVLRQRKDIESIVLTPAYKRIVRQRQLADADLRLKGDPHPSALKHGILGDLLTPYFLKYIY